MFKALITQHHTEPIVQKIAYDLVLNPNTVCAAPNTHYLIQRFNDTRELCSNPYATADLHLGCFVDYFKNS